MKTTNSLVKNIYFLFFLIIFGLILNKFESITERPKLQFEGKTAITIGKVNKYSYSDGFKDCIEYSYIVNNHLYKSYEIPDYNKHYKMNKFYKVKYQKSNPEISELYLNKEIKDTILIKNSKLKIEKID